MAAKGHEQQSHITTIKIIIFELLEVRFRPLVAIYNFLQANV